MDVAGLSMALSQSKVMQSVGVSMLKEQLDVMSESADLMASAMATGPSPSLESLVNPSVGSNIDLTV